MTKAAAQDPRVKGTEDPVPVVCQFGVIVLWKLRRRTGNGIERPGREFDLLGQSFAIARVGLAPGLRQAFGPATIIQDIIKALWKGGVIRHGVGVGVNIPIESAFRNLDKAQFLEVLFGVADI